MLMKLFGVMDLISAIVLFLLRYEIGMSVGWVFAVYLLIKGFIFLPGVASVMDLLSGLVFIFALSGFSFFLSWIFILWLLQKGFFSLMS